MQAMLVLVLACLMAHVAVGPVSQPVAHPGQLPRNEYTTRQAMKLEDITFGTDATALRQDKCGVHFEVAWTNKMRTGVYATPVIDSIIRDGTKQIVASGFFRDLEIFDSDGHRLPGWPVQLDDVYFHSSPLLHDYNRDGFKDIVWTSVNGELFIVSGHPTEGGTLLRSPWYVPKLRIKKHWYRGLDYDADLKMGVKPNSEKTQSQGSAKPTPPASGETSQHGRKLLGLNDDQEDEWDDFPEDEGVAATELEDYEPDQDDAAVYADDGADYVSAGQPSQPVAPTQHKSTPSSRTKPMQEVKTVHKDNLLEDHHQEPVYEGGHHDKNKDSLLQMPLKTKPEFRSTGIDLPDGAQVPKLVEEIKEVHDEAWVEPQWEQIGDGLTAEGKESLKLFTETPQYVDSGSVDHVEASYTGEYKKQPRGAAGRADNTDGVPQYAIEEDYVWVDAHIMASPTLADVDGDNVPDVVLSVSYFYDEDEFASNPWKFKHVGKDVDVKKYVAGGLVVFSPAKNKVVWSEHLDLTTDETDLRAFIYASPTVVDLEGDGKLEVIVGTSLGFLYVLDAKTGKTHEGFPLVMSEVQAQVTVADVNNDGILEMVAVDNKGNVLCYNKNAEKVWDAHISGFAAQGATFADVDGNGSLDVILGTITGHIWALDGQTGATLKNFPVKTEGKILAPVLPVQLHDIGLGSIMGQSLVVPSFDGYVYIIHGQTGCVNKVDIGEKAYGMVLADDITNDGKTDLLVTTMSGNLYCISTSSRHHPLKSWRSQNRGLNGFTQQSNYHGIFVTDASRQFRDVLGHSVTVEFTIVDKRKKSDAHKSYYVQIRLGGRVVFTEVYEAAGTYTAHISSPRTAKYDIVEVEMYNEHHQYFSDSFSLGFNIGFYRTLKYVIAVPFLAMSTLVLFVTPSSGPGLPTLGGSRLP